MSDITKELTLAEAWAKRNREWARGTQFIEEGNKMWKQIVSLPGKTNVSVWLSISENCMEAANKISTGYTIRYGADEIWHDAVIRSKGTKSKMSWEHVPEKKAYRCVLDSGEVFEP